MDILLGRRQWELQSNPDDIDEEAWTVLLYGLSIDYHHKYQMSLTQGPLSLKLHQVVIILSPVREAHNKVGAVNADKEGANARDLRNSEIGVVGIILPRQRNYFRVDRVRKRFEDSYRPKVRSMIFGYVIVRMLGVQVETINASQSPEAKQKIIEKYKISARNLTRWSKDLEQDSPCYPARGNSSRSANRNKNLCANADSRIPSIKTLATFRK